MSKRSVSVKGGELYEVGEFAGDYYVSKYDPGIIFSSSVDVGKTRSLGDALELIKSHSGKEIRNIR